MRKPLCLLLVLPLVAFCLKSPLTRDTAKAQTSDCNAQQQQIYSFAIDVWGDSNCSLTSSISYPSHQDTRNRYKFTPLGVTPSSPYAETALVTFADPLPAGSRVVKAHYTCLGRFGYSGTGCGIGGTSATCQAYLNGQPFMGSFITPSGPTVFCPNPGGVVSKGPSVNQPYPTPLYKPGENNTFKLTLQSMPCSGDPTKGGGGMLLERVMITLTYEPPPDITSVSLNEIDGIDDQLDADPNNAPCGVRIFPDKLNPADTTNRRVVRVLARTRFGGNKTIYFKSFDVDDPSSDADVDSTGLAGDDNFGSPKPGVLSKVGQVGTTNMVSAKTSADGTVAVDLTVTQQPGDNFIVAASADEAYLDNIRVQGSVLYYGNPSGGVRLPSVKANHSPLLTVWRRLHVEVDSMGPATGNNLTGTIRGAELSVETGETGLLIDKNILIDNRYENGRITIDGVGSYKVAGNEQFNIVIVDDLIPPAMIPPNATFTLVDDDDFNGDDLVDGVPVPNGDEGDDIPRPDMSYLAAALAPAYVLPVYDVGDSNDAVTFAAAVAGSPDDFRSFFDFDAIATEEDSLFWTIYILGAYEPDPSRAGDPDSIWAQMLLGATDTQPSAGNDAQGSCVYVETQYGEGPTCVWCEQRFTVAHEVGHIFGSDHGDKGLMADNTQEWSPKFSGKSLAAIRNTLFP